MAKIDALKENFFKVKRRKCNIISIFLLAVIPVFIVLSILPYYLCTGVKLTKHLFQINYGLSLAFAFLAVTMPLIVFSDIYYFTLTVDFSSLKKAARKNGSYLPVWYRVSVFSFLYALVLLLITYFAAPAFARISNVSFNTFFPYLTISFIQYPIIYLLSALFVSGIILLFASSPYVYYILIASSLIFNVVLIGMFRVFLSESVLCSMAIVIIAALLIVDAFLMFKLRNSLLRMHRI